MFGCLIFFFNYIRIEIYIFIYVSIYIVKNIEIVGIILSYFFFVLFMKVIEES